MLSDPMSTIRPSLNPSVVWGTQHFLPPSILEKLMMSPVIGQLDVMTSVIGQSVMCLMEPSPQPICNYKIAAHNDYV